MLSLLSVLFVHNYTKYYRKSAITAVFLYAGILLCGAALTVLCLLDCCSAGVLLMDVAAALAVLWHYKNL